MAKAAQKSQAQTERNYSNQSRKNQKPDTVRKGKYSDADYNNAQDAAAPNRDEEGRAPHDVERTSIEQHPAQTGRDEQTKYNSGDDYDAKPSRGGASDEAANNRPKE